MATSHSAAMCGFRGASLVRVVWTFAALLAVLVLMTLSVVVAHASTLVASSPDIINVDAQADQAVEPTVRTRQVSSNAASVSVEDAREAGFQVDDASTVWGTSTAVDLFKSQYESPDDASVTVRSQTGDKVVAPGTSNAYAFAVRNTGEVSMDYQITARVDRAGSDDIPLELSLVGPDGVDVEGMGQQGTLAPGTAAQYVLRWEWPFESNADVADTQLGQATLSQQLSYTVTIDTLAAVSADAASGAGVAGSVSASGLQGAVSWLSQTGDGVARVAMIAAVVAVLAACVALVARRRG